MTEALAPNRRVLLIDDNPAIHDDIRKVLASHIEPQQTGLADDEEFLFGETTSSAIECEYELSSAYQGRAGLELVQQGLMNDEPFAVALVDMRMPPGWDGLETAQKLWQADPNLLIIFCTAYSDYSWREMISQLGQTDRFVILKKPFDKVELQQLVGAMVQRWHVTRLAQSNLNEMLSLLDRNRSLQDENFSLRDRLSRYESVTGFNPSSLFDAPGLGRVLSLDCDSVMQTELARELSVAGAEVICLEHGQDALAEVQAARQQGHPFAAIVLELALPGMTGFEVVEALRDQGYTGRIIAYTQLSSRADHSHSLALGCDNCLTKSTPVAGLVASLQKALVPEEMTEFLA